MNELYEAVIQADIKSLAAREAVAYLKSRGHPDITEARYAQLKSTVCAQGPYRLAQIATNSLQHPADVIANLEAMRIELWRNYCRIYGLAPPPKDGGKDDLAPAKRADRKIAAVMQRVRMLVRIEKLVIYKMAYVWAAEIMIGMAPQRANGNKTANSGGL